MPTSLMLAYVHSMTDRADVHQWAKTHLEPYVAKQPLPTEEIEHVIDWLASDAAPRRVSRLAVKDAIKAARKWSEKLQAEAAEIQEQDGDTETVLDFGDGFRMVRLIGERAYQREGFLMRHCVASYFGKATKIYSLRDAKNEPHCTIEEDMQIKGKGNGDIHPKYVGYVVRFLEYLGMEVRDAEMRHLGYRNAEKFAEHLSADCMSGLFRGKYHPINKPLIDKDGEVFASLEMFSDVPLVEWANDELQINYDLTTFVPAAVRLLEKNSDNSDNLSGYGAQIGSSGYDAQIGSSGDRAQIGSSGKYAVIAAIGVGSRVSAALGSWITLAEYDSDLRPACVRSAQIDGEKLLPDTWYRLEHGEFVAC